MEAVTTIDTRWYQTVTDDDTRRLLPSKLAPKRYELQPVCNRCL
jgi:hypothetical protein